MNRKRERAEKRGHLAELIALMYLRLKGYRCWPSATKAITARLISSCGGVMSPPSLKSRRGPHSTKALKPSPQANRNALPRRRDVTAFIEVKARGSHDHGVEAVTNTQSKRIAAAARFWMARDKISNQNFCRFDIVVVNAYFLPHHIENAFPGDA